MQNPTGQFQLTPPYCPNSRCLFHFGTESKFYVKNGLTKTEKPPFKNQRYRCKRCNTQFSDNTFSFDFRRKIAGIGETVLHSSLSGTSNNEIARIHKTSEGTVRNRLKELSRQSLLFEKLHPVKLIQEDVAYDGFETFSYSQFSPCYINTAVGSHSMFIYHNTFSPLNRKGRMTMEQKKKNLNLCKMHGFYPRDSVFQESVYIIKNLSEKAPGRTLFTDEHYAYQKALRSFDCKLEHKTIHSEVRRDPSNPLFPINRLHNLYRHFLSSQHRETISFQKHEAALLEKIQLMKIYSNFMKTKFVKKIKFDPYAHEWSPAMYVGLTDRVLSFNEVFGLRRMKTQFKIDERETNFMNRYYPYSRQKISV